MAFAILPALDLAGGRLVTWSRAGVRPVDAFGGDPLRAASAAADAGASWVHVVDVDRATEGGARSLDVIAAVSELGLRVQASGGIVSSEQVAEAIAAGAARVVLASGALVDGERVGELVAAHGPRLMVGLEVDDGRVRSRFGGALDLDPIETIGWLTALGAAGFVVTALARVGALAGPDVSLIRRCVRSGRPVIAAGGVSSLADLEALRGAGAAGAVVGRAALDGALDLREALLWAAAPEGTG